MGKNADKKAADKKVKIKAPEIHAAIPGGSEPVMDRIEAVLSALDKTAEKYDGDQESFNVARGPLWDWNAITRRISQRRRAPSAGRWIGPGWSSI